MYKCKKWLLAAKFPTSSIHSNTIILKLTCLPTCRLKITSGGLPYFHFSLWKIPPGRLAVWREERPDLLRVGCYWISPGGVKKRKILSAIPQRSIFLYRYYLSVQWTIHTVHAWSQKSPATNQSKHRDTANNHICRLRVRALTGKNWIESSKHKIPELHKSYLSSLHITVNSSGSQKTPSWIWSVKKRIYHVENVCEFFSPFISSYIDLISVEGISAEIHQSISNAFDFGDWRYWLEM